MVGRFQVMALLQAARATMLGAARDEAESFGLNRAIFYAAAKRGFHGKSQQKRTDEQRGKTPTAPDRTTPVHTDTIGNETAYFVEQDGKKRYMIGDEVQQPEDFQRQVAQRFGPAFPHAWEQAIQLVQQADRATLESQHRFYEDVYQPHRDELASAWSELSQQPARSASA